MITVLVFCKRNEREFMKKFLLIILLLVGVGVGGYFYYDNFIKEKDVHYHAGFRVYVDGKLQDFSDIKYMHYEPCSEGDSHHDEDDQIEKAHLHDKVGDVVHVHRDGAVWGDLFKNIGYKIDEKKGLLAYVNGEKVDGVLSYPIKPYDSLVLLVGKHGDVKGYLKKAVVKRHIVEVEGMSESCGD